MSHADRRIPTRSSRGRRVVAVPALALLVVGGLAVGACENSPPGPAALASEGGAVEVRASVRTPTVSTLVVEVTADNIPDPQVFNLELVGADTDGDGVDDEFTASDVLTVPAGAGRLFDARAYDDAGIRTHEGSAVMDVTPGPNARAVVVTLDPLTGRQPIEIVLGSFDVTVTPARAEIVVGASQAFSAAVTDEDGPVEGATVRWASSNPGVASVDGAGLATGEADGAARIVATWMGVGGEAGLTVGAGGEASYVGTYAISPMIEMTCPTPAGLESYGEFSVGSIGVSSATPDELVLDLHMDVTALDIGTTLSLPVALDSSTGSFDGDGPISFELSGSGFFLTGEGALSIQGAFSGEEFTASLDIRLNLATEISGFPTSGGRCTDVSTTVTGTPTSG